MCIRDRNNGEQVNLTQFWGTTGIGGGTFTWRENGAFDKSDHDGGVIIDPLVDFQEDILASDWTPNSGPGVWVRDAFDQSNFPAEWYGAQPDHSSRNHRGIMRALNGATSITAIGRTVLLNGHYPLTQALDLQSKNRLLATGTPGATLTVNNVVNIVKLSLIHI